MRNLLVLRDGGSDKTIVTHDLLLRNQSLKTAKRERKPTAPLDLSYSPEVHLSLSINGSTTYEATKCKHVYKSIHLRPCAHI
jgi:hypothetical protein